MFCALFLSCGHNLVFQYFYALASPFGCAPHRFIRWYCQKISCLSMNLLKIVFI